MCVNLHTECINMYTYGTCWWFQNLPDIFDFWIIPYFKFFKILVYHNHIVYLINLSIIYFGGTGNWIQDLMLARQAFYYQS
jgi:hypothetical protein